jgi:hypothetical protein
MRHAEANSASARSRTKGSARATERRGCCAEATATETTSASNRSSPTAPADDMAATTEASSSAVITATLRLPDQDRARKQCDPIEFNFHDLDFLCVDAFQFILLIRLAKATRHSQRFAGDPRGIGRREEDRGRSNVFGLAYAAERCLCFNALAKVALVEAG